MKKAFFLIAALLFAVSITKLQAYAQESVVETDNLLGQEVPASQSANITKTINYELPYPGMLPDNPFYFLKVLRDGILKLIINDDLKRARFSLESGEKRIYAGRLLAEKNKDGLAVDTFSKGNNYLNEALLAIKKYSVKNPKSTDVKPFLSEFDTATLKMLEVSNDIKPSIDKAYLQAFLDEQKRLKRTDQIAKEMLLEK